MKQKQGQIFSFILRRTFKWNRLSKKNAVMPTLSLREFKGSSLSAEWASMREKGVLPCLTSQIYSIPSCPPVATMCCWFGCLSTQCKGTLPPVLHEQKKQIWAKKRNQLKIFLECWQISSRRNSYLLSQNDQSLRILGNVMSIWKLINVSQWSLWKIWFLESRGKWMCSFWFYGDLNEHSFSS